MSKSKPILIIALFIVSAFGAPAMMQVRGETTANYDDINTTAGLSALEQGVGQMFGMFREFGASGDALGSVFETMFLNFQNMSNTEASGMGGVYVMNASIITEQESGTYDYSEGNDWEYRPWGAYNLENATGTEYDNEYPYFKFVENGTLSYNKTEGAQITFTIWDQDGSFIEAIDKVIETVKTLQAVEASNESDDAKQLQAVNAAVEAITYFLIHINDIITGDEVIIFNVIAFTNYVSDFAGSMNGTWYITENRHRTDSVVLNDTIYPGWATEYRSLAEELDDDVMLYILNEGYLDNRFQNYTAFSFDIVEVWLKNFEVHIDVAAIMDAVYEAQQAVQTQDPNYNAEDGVLGDSTLTDIFQGLDIEFYIFTHHFQNWYLFDDEKFDRPELYNADVLAKANNGVPDVIFESIGDYENETVDVISDSEIQDYILFRGADWSFVEPDYENGKMTWGVRADNLNFRVIPVGMKDDNVNLTDAPIERMDYMELGFSFEPTAEYNNIDNQIYLNPNGVQTMGMATVKLVQSFGNWDLDIDGKPFTPHLKDDSLDLTSVFMSTILHVHLQIDNQQVAATPEEVDQTLLDENNYDNETSYIKVGDVDNELPLAEIDIAGPNYTQTDDLGTESNYQAKTTIIPTVYAEWEGQTSETYTQEDNSTGAMAIQLNIEFSALLYAVSYYSFDSTGDEIVHDPTFNVFIIAEKEAIWAIILVVGTVALVGIAAVLITKKKNKNMD